MEIDESTKKLRELIGKRLIELRNQNGLSKTEVAQKLGICPATYKKYEEGTTAIPFNKALLILELYEGFFDSLVYLWKKMNK